MNKYNTISVINFLGGLIMGLIGIIGKMASSKVVEKIENELSKKQNREQTSKYCTYINNNIQRICKMTSDLKSETQSLINEIINTRDVKWSFKEKGNLKKTKEKVFINLKYLYLSRDFFTTLSKNICGLALNNEELMLVTKFAPYFDGTPILKLDDEDEDDSLLGEFKAAFVPSKKSSTYFNFEEYLSRYGENIEKQIIPDVDSAIESFISAIAAQKETENKAETATAVIAPTTIADEIECPSCHIKLGVNSKFCPECGNKVEIKKNVFCTDCGEPLSSDAKFCANCGKKL